MVEKMEPAKGDDWAWVKSAPGYGGWVRMYFGNWPPTPDYGQFRKPRPVGPQEPV